VRELNSLLKEPSARKELLESFSFDNQLLDSIQSASAVERAAESAEQYQTREVRNADLFAEPPLPILPLPKGEGRGEGEEPSRQPVPASGFAPRLMDRLSDLVGLFRMRWSRAIAITFGLAALACAAIVVGLELYHPIGVIEGNPVGVSILRNSELRPAGGGSKLWAGDRLKSPAESSTTIHYLREATQIKLQPGTQLRLDRDANGNRLEVITGAIAAKVAAQPVEHPMLIATPHSDVKVLGTEFLLSVDAASTHVEVIEGAVEICSREDGKAVKVNRDQFANVAHGVELAARSLLPAPWNSQDIGAVGMTGYARIDGHQCKIKAAGKADAKSKDQFHFLYQVLEGDGEIRARVVDLELTHDLAKAGILIRNSLKPASPQAFLYLKAKSGMEFEHRGPEMRKIVRAGRELAPYWLRLVKSGDSIKAFKSADGVNWVPIGTEQISMEGPTYFGLGVSSGNQSRLTTSVFDNVNIIAAGTNLVSAVSIR